MPLQGLGPDTTVCVGEFIEAMRAQVIADNPDNPDAGDKLDSPLVQKNFAPLGEAVYRILTDPARLRSDAATDAAFWQWVAEVNGWLADLAAWRQGVTEAFAAWNPTGQADRDLRDQLLAIPEPAPPPAREPSSLTGRIE